MPQPLVALRSSSPLTRELLWLLACLIVGVTLLPIAVYYTGVRVLGPYTGGGLWSFWGDFFRGLGHGGGPWWLIVAGPYALLLFVRAVRAGWRRFNSALM